MAILITGGVGFIGSHFVETLVSRTDELIVNLDCLAYSAVPKTLELLNGYDNHQFIEGSLADQALLTSLFERYRFDKIFHLAAESHVDNSIESPSIFIETNIVGTHNLLQAAYSYWKDIKKDEQAAFRFVHVSTDEVFGSLEADEAPFTEDSGYRPNSPYSASKASSDHLARAYFQTYGLPVITTHCSNNYGPRQLPEKLIPTVITKALTNQDIPLYGDGQQIRDWLNVKDHCDALLLASQRGKIGESYNIGGNCEVTNKQLVKQIINHLDKMRPLISGQSYKGQIKHVEDRLGHDRRYAINSQKAQNQLGWQPNWHIDDGLKDTVEWYLNNVEWLKSANKSLSPRG